MVLNNIEFFSSSDQKFQIPTVFSKDDRLILCAVVLCTEENTSKNFSLVYHLVETNAVNPKELLSLTLQTLVTNRKTEEVSTIIESILEWGLIPGSQIKNAVWPAIASAQDEIPQKVVKDIAKFLVTPKDKVIFKMPQVVQLSFFYYIC